MNVSQMLPIAICLVAIGCHGGVETDVMERELRHHEDRIYELEDYIDQYQALLDSCRRENRSLKHELGIADSEKAGGPALEQPQIEFDDEGPTFEGTQIDAAPFEEGQLAPDEGGARRASFETSPELATYKGPLHRIELNKLLSGGLDADGRPGDEGVLAVIEPRSASGKLIREPGHVSLMIRDADRKGPQAQLARWDFEPGELHDTWRKSPLAEGYVFELPWPADAPQGGQLQLWARLVTESGQKFLTHLDIDVEPGGSTVPPIGQFRRIEGWTAQKNFSPARQSGIEKPEDRTPRVSKRPDPVSAPSRSRLGEEHSRLGGGRTELIEVPPERLESLPSSEDAVADTPVTKPKKRLKRPAWKPDR